MIIVTSEYINSKPFPKDLVNIDEDMKEWNNQYKSFYPGNTETGESSGNPHANQQTIPNISNNETLQSQSKELPVNSSQVVGANDITSLEMGRSVPESIQSQVNSFIDGMKGQVDGLVNNLRTNIIKLMHSVYSNPNNN